MLDMDPPEDWDPSEEERDGFDSITCTVCKQWILDSIPRTCPNDHPSALCEECATGLVVSASKRGISPKCPTCREYFKKNKNWTRDVQKNLTQGLLSAYCPNGERREDGSRSGCPEKVKISKMLEHLEKCPYMQHPCSYQPRGCLVLAFDKIGHEESCPKRPAVCPYVPNGCDRADINYEDLVEHAPGCEYDGLLAGDAMGEFGLAVHSNSKRLVATGTRGRRFDIYGYKIFIFVTLEEYKKLLEVHDTVVYDERSAIQELRAHADSVGVWLSGVNAHQSPPSGPIPTPVSLLDMDIDGILDESTDVEVEEEPVDGISFRVTNPLLDDGNLNTPERMDFNDTAGGYGAGGVSDPLTEPSDACPRGAPDLMANPLGTPNREGGVPDHLANPPPSVSLGAVSDLLTMPPGDGPNALAAAILG